MTADALKEALVSGNILYISDPQIANGIPHYHVFIKKIDGGYLTTACCTSQFEKNLKHITLSRESLDTLVCIDHETSDNLLHDYTYVNCNGYISYTEADLLSLNAKRDIRLSGNVTAFEFQKIIRGFLLSRRVDEEFKEEIRRLSES